jgi:iron complex outermembrane receptor protein
MGSVMNQGILGDALVVAVVGVLLAAELEEITITAAKMRSLEQFTPTGSRLGLSQQELPATLDVIDNDEMIGRGLYNVQEAADSQPGVTSG